MFEYVTGDDIAAEAKMTRDNFPGAILLVEGDDDILFFEKFTEPKVCHMIPARRKENVLTAANLLDSEEFEGLLGIVDPDFWHITGYPKNLPRNICVGDNHDIEVMIFESRALIQLLSEYGSKEKIGNFIESLVNSDIRKAIYAVALPIGILRLISAKKGLRLNFKEINYEKFIDKDNLEIDIDRLIRILIESAESPLKDAELRSYYDKQILQQEELDRSQVCCGDDLIAVIYIGLRKVLGTVEKKFACRKYIASALRLAFDSEDLKKTRLYNCIMEWEVNNPPYKVLNF